MTSEDRIFACQLLGFLARSEQIAANCAQQQSKLAVDKKMRAFFSTQARQERQHAFVFNRSLQWLSEKNFQQINYSGLYAFEKKLANAFDRNDLAESIVAQQLLFEGLGEITLHKVSAGIEDRGFGFQRLRKIILNQERAHHHFGEKHINAVINAPEFDVQLIAKQCKEYLEILYLVLTEMESVLEFYNQSVQGFYMQLINDLPAKVREEI